MYRDVDEGSRNVARLASATNGIVTKIERLVYQECHWIAWLGLVGYLANESKES